VCSASGPTLAERYRHRITTGERHPGHTESDPLEETLARLRSGRWDALDLEGPVVTVNTESDLSAAALDAIVVEVRRAIGARRSNS
jgi:hypothetical protein